MNIINKSLLWLALLPKARYEKMGINTHQLKAILNTKLMMDDRTPSNFQQLRKRSNKEGKLTGTRVWAVIASIIMGLVFLGISVAYFKDDVMRLTVYFSFFIILFSLSLISDFTSVLIDIRDNYIILPKPVNDKTFLMARLLYILIYLIRIAFPMSLPGIIAVVIYKGIWAMLIFMLLIALITLFTIFIVNTIYLFILKITTPQKFQSIISYIQIFFTILLYAAYQLLPRLMQSSNIANFDANSAHWMWFVPSYWFALGWQFLSLINTDIRFIIGGIASIVIPLLSIWLVIKYMAPTFNRKLLLMTNSDLQPSDISKTGKTALSTTPRYSNKLATWFTKQGPERMAFLFTWKMTARSRDYRMKVLPAMGYIVVMVAMVALNHRKNFNLDDLRNSTEGASFIVIAPIYILCFVLFTAISQLAYSEKFKASWVYHIAPVETPGNLIMGGIKSVLVKFLLPFDLLILVGGILIGGVNIIPNLLFALINQLFICGVYGLFNAKNLPFSEEQTAGRNTKVVRNLVMMLILGIPIGLHYLVYDYLWMIVPLGLLSITGAFFVMKDIKKTTWRELYPG